MRKSFLWRGNNPYKGIHCLVNWEQICDLKCNRELEIIDLDCQNQALLIKWLWKISHEQEGIWATTLQQLHNISEVSHLGNGSNISFFLKHLLEITLFYDCSVRAVGLATGGGCPRGSSHVHRHTKQCTTRGNFDSPSSIMETKSAYESTHFSLVNVGK